MDGSAKIQLILELKNRMKTGLSKAKESVNSNVRDIKTRFSEFKIHAVDSLRSVAGEVPFIGTAFSLLKNPITLATGLIVGVGMALNAATVEAANFQKNFRQLQMLNLDKSIESMGNLKFMVKNVAFEKGFDLNKTSTAFFDVQSVTGKYGHEVKKIVAQQGEFARLMQADFNSWIEGTAKAMANYGFGAERLNEFNRAAFATVKTGVTTFDQLSKVMSVFAGSASSAKQDFAAANKIFSLFTVKVKSVDEAATLTKSLFTDLTKSSVIKSFKDIGINVYDNNNKFKQADALLLELSNKFKDLGDNDAALINLKNQFAGSEGLIAFIQAAMGSTEQLQNMINSFDTSGLDLSKALEISKKDITYINEQLEARLKILKTDIGESLLPTKIEWAQFKLDFIGNTRSFLNPTGAGERYKQLGTDSVLEKFSGIINDPGKFKTTEFDKTFGELKSLREIYQKSYDENRKYKGNFYEYHKTYERFNALFSKGALETIDDVYSKLLEYQSKLPQNHDDLLTGNGNANNPDDINPLASDSINKIVGSAKQIRNITVNIDSFNKGGINTQNTNLQQMDAEQIEQWFNDMMLRVIRNVELSY